MEEPGGTEGPEDADLATGPEVHGAARQTEVVMVKQGNPVKPQG